MNIVVGYGLKSGEFHFSLSTIRFRHRPMKPVNELKKISSGLQTFMCVCLSHRFIQFSFLRPFYSSPSPLNIPLPPPFVFCAHILPRHTNHPPTLCPFSLQHPFLIFLPYAFLHPLLPHSSNSFHHPPSYSDALSVPSYSPTHFRLPHLEVLEISSVPCLCNGHEQAVKANA